ncbi:GNAT family N-acetyltransferase [Parvularcula sp. LCG005]|uniref:GNAT family N-acetyltransferase n=1 Tax=Parvularcula sp. LCG005 TaxID=3078805 RepID=UPI00294328B4|nr:GNAT family N-acetyltransferase [Parvularcula sp. LCG005]WOI52392.1 GNAT family N-acetyltransferase [Parvularcula sp. LCG005]
MTSLEPTIRPAHAGDIDSLLDLELVFPEGDRATRRNWRDLLSGHSAVLIADQGESLGGAAVLLFRKGTTVGRLYSLAVAPAARGRGVARALLAASDEACQVRQCDRLRLEVRTSNEEALRLYRNNGYVVIGHKSSYYPDGEDAVHMEKRLIPMKDILS